MLRLEGSDGAPPRDNRSNSRSMDRPALAVHSGSPSTRLVFGLSGSALPPHCFSTSVAFVLLTANLYGCSRIADLFGASRSVFLGFASLHPMRMIEAGERDMASSS